VCACVCGGDVPVSVSLSFIFFVVVRRCVCVCVCVCECVCVCVCACACASVCIRMYSMTSEPSQPLRHPYSIKYTRWYISQNRFSIHCGITFQFDFGALGNAGVSGGSIARRSQNDGIATEWAPLQMTHLQRESMYVWMYLVLTRICTHTHMLSNAGYFGGNGAACYACSVGKFKEEEGSDDCTDCFAHATTPSTGSNSSFQCICTQGFQELRAGVSCQDIDECLTGAHDCSPSQALCTNTAGSFECACAEPFYSGNGTFCLAQSSAVQVSYFANVSIRNLQNASTFRNAFAQFLGVDRADVTVMLERLAAQTCTTAQSSNESSLCSTSLASRRLMQASHNDSFYTFTVHVAANDVQRAINTSNDAAGFNRLLAALSLPQMVGIQKLGALVAECGNGLLQNTERCDDGNKINNDGCSSVCHIERGWACRLDARRNHSVSVCSDINECLECIPAASETSLQSAPSDCLPVAQCSTLVASCVNTLGSYLCACRPGFLGDGLTCRDDLSNNNTLQRNTIFSQDPVRVLRASATLAPLLPNLGITVALSRNVALVGSEGNSTVLLFERGYEGEWAYTPTHVFSRPPSSSMSMFGNAIALHMSPGSNDLLSSNIHHANTVRASCAALSASHGAVYIYHKEPGGQWDVNPAAVLTASIADDFFFGASLALTYDELLVGVPGGSLALIFRRPTRNKYGVTLKWNAAASFRLDGHSNLPFLGQCVALSQTHAVVASYSSARVVVFERLSDGSWPRSGTVLYPADLGKECNRVEINTVCSQSYQNANRGSSSFGSAVSLSQSFLVISDSARRYVSIFSTMSSNMSTASRSDIRPADGGVFGQCVSNTDLYLVVGSLGSNRVTLYQSLLNKTWPSSPVQVITYEAPNAASSVGASCALNNQDVLIPSFSRAQGHVFVHSSSCAKGFYGLTSDHCYQCPFGTTSKKIIRVVTGCACLPGTFGPAGGPCSLCLKNHFCPSGSSANPCPNSTSSRNGSSLMSECADNRWILKTMSQTSSLPGMDNMLELNISLNIEITPQDNVFFTISGLTCGSTACMPCSGAGLSLTGSILSSSDMSSGAAHSIFSDTCARCGLFNGSLTVQHVGDTLKNDIFRLTFCLRNPLTAQVAPDMYISASGGSDVYIQRIDAALGSQAPLGVLGLKSAIGWQSTSNQRQSNRITIVLQTFAVPARGTRIVLTNLLYSEKASATIELRHTNFTTLTATSAGNTSHSFCSSGSWSRSNMQLVATFCHESSLPTTLTLQFEMLNGASTASAPNISIQIVSAGGKVVDSRNLILPFGKAAEEQIGVVAGFLVSHIVQSTSLPSSENEVTATLVSSVALHTLSRFAEITISGLIGSHTVSNDNLVLSVRVKSGAVNTTEADQDRVETSTGKWLQQSGSLTFQVPSTVAARDIFILTWTITNPSAGQRSPTSISVESSTVEITSINMTKGIGSERVLRVAGFDSVRVSQSSACPNSINTISISFKLFLTIPYNVSPNSPNMMASELVITGLTGTESDSISAMSATAATGGALTVAVESWGRGNGTLVISLSSATQMLAGTTYTLDFDVVNNVKGSDAANVAISGRGTAMMSQVQAVSSHDLSSPFRVHGVRSVSLTQGSSSVNEPNTLMLALSFFVPLPDEAGGVNVTISGLVGSALPSTAALPITQIRLLHDTVIAGNADWDQMQGNLIVTFAGSNISQVATFYETQRLSESLIYPEYRFTFTLINPNVGHASPSHVQISAAAAGRCAAGIIQPQFIPKAVGYLAAMLIADFLAPTMYQSDASVAVLNRVTLVFHTTGFLPKGSRIVIQGIECVRCGSVPDQCSLLLRSVTVNNTHFWDDDIDKALDDSPITFADTETRRSTYPIAIVVLRVMQDLSAGAISMTFSVRNSDCGADPTPQIFISVEPSEQSENAIRLSIPPRFMTLGQGFSQPLLVNYFVNSLVRQSAVGSGAHNMISFSFSSKAPLAANSQVVLSGKISPTMFIRIYICTRVEIQISTKRSLRSSGVNSATRSRSSYIFLRIRSVSYIDFLGIAE